MPGKKLREGIVSVMGGMTEMVHYPLISESMYAEGLNVSSRGGVLKTRPAFKKLAVTLPGTGVFKGAEVYRLNDTDRFVYGEGSSVHQVNLSTLAVTSFAPGFDSDEEVFHFCQVDKYMVVQDSVANPLILDDVSTVDQSSANEYDRFPPGHVMAYGHNRAHVVVSNVYDPLSHEKSSDLGRRFFRSGDLLDPSDTTTGLLFTEDQYLSEGGAHTLPTEMGFINGLAFFRNAQTGTGVGALVVFAREGVSAFAVNSPRTQWGSIDISQVLFTSAGTESPRSIVAVNDDLLFRSHDGFRTVKYTASREANGSGALSCLPISYEIYPTILQDPRELLPYVSAAFADNRVFMTTGGVSGDEPYFKYVAVLDTAPLASITSQTPAPAYDGFYTGLNFLQVLRARYDGRDTLFAFTRSADGELELWKLEDDTSEEYVDGVDTPTQCRIKTRGFVFGNLDTLKTFDFIDLWVSDVRGPASVTAYWRADGYELWNECNTISFCADMTESGAQPQSRYRIRLQPADETYDPVSGRSTDVGACFQFCIEWTGRLKIEKILFNATEATDTVENFCEEDGTDCVALTEGSGGIVLTRDSYTIG